MPESRAHARSRRAGFSLVEVSVAMTVAAIAIGGLMAAVTSVARLQVSTQSFDRASRAVQEVHESLRGGDLDARIAALQAAPVFPDGPLTITVGFPESVLVDQIGGPVPLGWRYRDLNGDGEVELDAGATASTSLVPVSVQATWTGGVLRTNFVVTEK